jgi:hypothetical protein
MYNMYIQSKYSIFLFKAYQHIYNIKGDSLGPTELYSKVANLFNVWYTA